MIEDDATQVIIVPPELFSQSYWTEELSADWVIVQNPGSDTEHLTDLDDAEHEQEGEINFSFGYADGFLLFAAVYLPLRGNVIIMDAQPNCGDK
ncbi:unnamed protein product [Dibothriocephalus latus]|uniref:Uncharacterized protein n=1 Tax=Dibothriocephalus latus TaxID=60516 RepID=A0A3P7PID3_DIBLA|nr:unnamed protein product [Dibothriocephalus latus]